MTKKLIALLLVVISIICDKGISVYAADITWPFMLKYHSNIYNEEDDSLKDSDFYKNLIELCNEKGRRHTYDIWVLKGLQNLSVDTSIKWLRQFLNEPKLICKITTDDDPLRVYTLSGISEYEKEDEKIHNKKLEIPAYRMWDIIGKDYSLSRALNIMSVGVAYGYLFTEMSKAEAIEELGIMFDFWIAIPENIGNANDSILDSTLKIVQFKISYNLDQYFENQENMNVNNEHPEQCDCEALRLWNVDNVEISGQEVTALDFLRGNTPFMTVCSYSY